MLQKLILIGLAGGLGTLARYGGLRPEFVMRCRIYTCPTLAEPTQSNALFHNTPLIQGKTL